MLCCDQDVINCGTFLVFLPGDIIKHELNLVCSIRTTFFSKCLPTVFDSKFVYNFSGDYNNGYNLFELLWCISFPSWKLWKYLVMFRLLSIITEIILITFYIWHFSALMLETSCHINLIRKKKTSLFLLFFWLFWERNKLKICLCNQYI